MKIKKQGAGKGSWGSTKDDIHDAKQMLDEGDLPPVSSPEREKSMRKVGCRRFFFHLAVDTLNFTRIGLKADNSQCV
jgi:hypothetical protein